MSRSIPLSQAVLGRDTLLSKALLVVGGSALIALAAQVSVPMLPVAMTLQTLAILVVGFSYGARLAAVTLLAYLAEGALGLPVFAAGRSTLALIGPSAGFLYGFVVMAFLAGLASDLGFRRLVPTALVAIVLSAMIYVPGVAWAMLADSVLGLDAAKWGADSFAMIWQYYMQPFLIGDAVKAVLAAMILTGAWAGLAARKG